MHTGKNWKTDNLDTRDLVLFFVIAFAWTWVLWSPFIFNVFKLPEGTGTSSVNLSELGPILPIILLGPFGPTIAAFIMSYWGDGQEGVKLLWSRFRNSKIPRTWLFITLALYPCIFLLLRFSSAIIFNVNQPTPIWINNPFVILAPFAASILHGGLSEEFGWRGYALPRLQSRFNSTQASIILGFIEGLWHVPLVFWVGDSRYGMSIPLLIIWQMIATFYRTWIYNNTDGSVLSAVLFHAMGNTASDIAPINLPLFSWLPRYRFVSPYLLIVFTAIVFVILGLYGYKNMIQKKSTKNSLM